MKEMIHNVECMNVGRAQSLQFHLSCNFYPPLPEVVKREFIDVFQSYWDGELSVEELPQALEDRAGYVGGLDRYDFWQFLKSEDMEEC